MLCAVTVRACVCACVLLTCDRYRPSRIGVPGCTSTNWKSNGTYLAPKNCSLLLFFSENFLTRKWLSYKNCWMGNVKWTSKFVHVQGTVLLLLYSSCVTWYLHTVLFYFTLLCTCTYSVLCSCSVSDVMKPYGRTLSQNVSFLACI